MNKERLAEEILTYYEKNARSLPWRDDPSPYRVWVSEIMLQQTRVDTVIDYFNRFMKVFPTVADLAEAKEEVLLKQWEGLGYYSRARNLQKAAKTIVAEWKGVVPEEKADLLSLAGIGEYTAGAISSIAYGRDEVAVDGNFIRLACRLLAYDGNVWNAGGKRFITEFWESVLPEGRASFFNQGIMDIGATICLPNGEPHCQKCPISSHCQSYAKGNPLDYPIKKEKKKRKIEEKTILLLYWHDKVLIRRRPKKGLLAGLLEFPMMDGHASQDEVIAYLQECGFDAIRIKRGDDAKHIFSHIEWRMISWEVKVDAFMVFDDVVSNEEWLNCKEITDITMPTAFKVYRKNVIDSSRV